MRKLVAISTLLLYLTLSVVQVVSIHLCHGKLESVALLEGKDDCCDGMHACHSSCCEDIIIEVDFDTDHIYPEEISVILPDQVFDLNYFIHDLLTDAEINETVVVPIPPGSRTLPKLFCFHSSFLFYG